MYTHTCICTCRRVRILVQECFLYFRLRARSSVRNGSKFILAHVSPFVRFLKVKLCFAHPKLGKFGSLRIHKLATCPFSFFGAWVSFSKTTCFLRFLCSPTSGRVPLFCVILNLNHILTLPMLGGLNFISSFIVPVCRFLGSCLGRFRVRWGLKGPPHPTVFCFITGFNFFVLF